jgi:catechol 2,3-dioxygenase-like lactoylglutathione lyase family enzyme
MLTAIVAVTLSVPDLQVMEAAYTQHLRYRVVDRGEVSKDLASAWDAPLAEGRRFLLLQPESGAPVYLRLVQSPPTPGYAVMKTHGWNSNEILCEDPDKLALELANSPFKIIGPPRPLSATSPVRAMQVIGPAGELNYLTRIPPQGGASIKTPAQSYVDRTFIVVLGGPDMEAMRRFYQDVLKLKVGDPYAAAIQVLNDAWQTPGRTTPLALALISPGFAIELDGYPPPATTRPQRRGDLPPGMAIVSFAVPQLDGVSLPWVAAPKAQSAAPYGGRKSALLRGAAGELIELIAER